MVDSLSSSVGMRKLAAIEVRLAGVERTMPQMAQAIRETFATLGDEVARLTAVVRAVTVEIGEDKIQARLDEETQLQHAEMVREAKAQLARMLEDGRAEEVPLIAEDTTIVGTVVNADGEEQPPYYAQFPMSRAPDYAQELIGKAAGARLAQPDGTFVVVKQVVRITGKQVAPPAPEPAQEADEAPAPEAAGTVGG